MEKKTKDIDRKNKEKDFSEIDSNLGNVSSFYSKAYLRHLIINREMLGSQIASIHNLNFYLSLVQEAREEIKKDTFHVWKEKILNQINNRL